MTTQDTTPAVQQQTDAIPFYDFYIVTVSGKIRDMVKAGIDRKRIRQEFVGWEQYGMKRYRRYENQYTAATFDVLRAGTDAASDAAMTEANKWRVIGLQASVRYHVVD